MGALLHCRVLLLGPLLGERPVPLAASAHGMRAPAHSRPRASSAPRRPGYLISMGMSLMSLLIALLFYDLSKRMGIAIIALTGVARVNSLFTLWGGNVAELLGRRLGPRSDERQNIAHHRGRGHAGAGEHAHAAVGEGPWPAAGASGWSGRPIISPRRACGAEQHRRALRRRVRIVPLESPGRRDRAASSPERQDQPARSSGSCSSPPGTLKAHIQHIYVKCGVHSRKELLQLCGGE